MIRDLRWALWGHGRGRCHTETVSGTQWQSELSLPHRAVFPRASGVRAADKEEGPSASGISRLLLVGSINSMCSILWLAWLSIIKNKDVQWYRYILLVHALSSLYKIALRWFNWNATAVGSISFLLNQQNCFQQLLLNKRRNLQKSIIGSNCLDKYRLFLFLCK